MQKIEEKNKFQKAFLRQKHTDKHKHTRTRTHTFWRHLNTIKIDYY